MPRKLLIGLVAVCALVGWGCGEEPESSSTTVRPASEMPQSEARHLETETAKGELPSVVVPKVKVPEAPRIDSTEVKAMIAQATPLLEKAKQYIKDNKLELAKTAIDELLKMKTMLPPEWQDRIDAVVKAFDARKALGGLQLPG